MPVGASSGFASMAKYDGICRHDADEPSADFAQHADATDARVKRWRARRCANMTIERYRRNKSAAPCSG